MCVGGETFFSILLVYFESFLNFAVIKKNKHEECNQSIYKRKHYL